MSNTGPFREAALLSGCIKLRSGIPLIYAAYILGCLTLRTGVSSKLMRSRRARCSWKAGFIHTPLLLWMPAQW